MSYFLESAKTGLRPISVKDATDEYLSWMNDNEVTRGLETGIFPTTRESLVSFVEKLGTSKDNVFLAICDKSTGKHIGNIKLGNIHWIHRHGELGILIGDKSAWGKGFASDACRLVVEYAFNKLNLHKVWLAVFSNNPGAIKVYQRLNFVEEGRLKEHVFSEGKFSDKILMSVFNNNK